MAAPATTITPDQKLARALNPSFEKVTEVIDTRSTEVLIAIQGVVARLDVLERQLAERKKPVATKARTPADGSALPAGAVVAPGTNFPATKMVYFKQKYKQADPAWLAKYVPAGALVGIEDDPTVKARKDDAKNVARATYIVNWLRMNDKTLFDVTLAADFAADKAAHEAANKPAQQQVDAASPEGK